MGLRKMLCNFSAAATLAMLALLATGCATTTTARLGDWRESVKAGDFQSAYSDLYGTWRAGTPDVRAETLRYAWRDPRIVAVAQPDLVAKIQPVADAHQGDLQTLARALRDGPLEDRIDFAKLVDRKLDLDREIASAYERRRLPSGGTTSPPVATATRTEPVPSASLQEAKPTPSTGQPAAAPRPATAPRPAVTPQPATTPPPVATPRPAAVPPAAATPQSTATPQPTAKPQAEEKSQAAATHPPKAMPEPTAKPTVTAKAAPQPEQEGQVAEAKRRAVWRCKGAQACDKAWTAAESFVGLNTDMRIRTAKSPTIETYPPIEIGKVGMKVEKVPQENDEAELRLTVACRVGVLRQLCPATELRIYTSFPEYMQAAARR